MALEVKVAQKIDKDYVKVEANSPQVPTRYFKVPAPKADSFCSSYEKEAKRNSTRNYVAMFISVLTACGITGIFTKSLNKTLQTVAGITAGLAGLAGATFFSTKKAIANEEEMLKQYNASEIFQDKKKMPI